MVADFAMISIVKTLSDAGKNSSRTKYKIQETKTMSGSQKRTSNQNETIPKTSAATAIKNKLSK